MTAPVPDVYVFVVQTHGQADGCSAAAERAGKPWGAEDSPPRARSPSQTERHHRRGQPVGYGSHGTRAAARYVRSGAGDPEVASMMQRFLVDEFVYPASEPGWCTR
jgi:hypothetical protein